MKNKSQIKKRNRKSQKVYGKSTHYWTEEWKTFLIAGACIVLALEHSQEARDSFQKIVETWDRPGCQAFADGLTKDNIAVPQHERINSMIAARKGQKYEWQVEWFPKTSKTAGENTDFQYIKGLMIEFINISFNRKNDFKVSGEKAPYLLMAVGMASWGKYTEMHPEKELPTKLTVGDKVIDARFLEGVSSERLHRTRTKYYKRMGYSLTHHDKLQNIAWYWFQCRVVCSGTEECCIKLQLKGKNWTPANLVKEIRLGDIATGYPRRNQPEQDIGWY